jgi:hypothetical protein
MSKPDARRSLALLRALTSAAACLLVAGRMFAQPSAEGAGRAGAFLRPNEFGFEDRISVISATSFFPSNRYYNSFYYLSPSFGRYVPFDIAVPVYYYASLDVPTGAIIDSIGLNSTTDQDQDLTARILLRDYQGNVETLGSVTSAVHGWDTDYSDPLSIPVTGQLDHELVLEVEQAASSNFSHDEYFAWVEVHWRRTVSSPPDTPSFGDVPATHPFFQFIEALKASGITGGCGDGSNYCPDAPLTRGQMAVFLAKALGLHWPN